jgi:tRNA(Ile)-lysidine synthetase-like protein
MKPSLTGNLSLLSKTATYLVAVSFGPDSMALLDYLYQLGYQLRVAHVNYHKRKISDLEQESLIQYCFERDIPIDVLSVAAKLTGNFQATARNIRYDFFLKIVNQYGLAGVLTAHHLDDSLETAMMQFDRGTYYDYFGIREQSTWQGMTIFRPLLAIEKQTLITYCQDYHVPYAIDASNQERTYLRNRMRYKLNRFTPEQKTQFIQTIIDRNALIQSKFSFLVTETKKHYLQIKTYLNWDEETMFLYWHRKSQQHQLHFPITKAFLTKVFQAIRSPKPNIRFKIQNNWLVTKSYHTLALINLAWLKPFEFKVSRKKKITLPLISIDFSSYPEKPFPKKCRSAKPTDRIKHKTFTKTFRRMAIDWKMPLHLRSIWPVLLNHEGEIIYLPRYEENQQNQANNWLQILE